MQKTIWIGVAGCIISIIALTLVSFNIVTQNSNATVTTNSHDMGGMSGGMDHSMTAVQQVCKPASGMPPHYCEPTYKTMSSVSGIKISKVEPVSDTEVKAIIREVSGSKVPQKLVLVGGSGYLSGATLIEGGWDKTEVVHLKFDGKGTIYDFTEMHLHLFPYTED